MKDNKIHRSKSGRNLALIASVSALLLALTSQSKAADLNWLGPDDGESGGDGFWNTTSLNWDTTSTFKWSNGNSAIFGGAFDESAGGTVTLNETGLSAAALFFYKNYTLNADSNIGAGRTLTLTGNVTIDPTITATLGANLTVTRAAPLYVDGGGILVIDNTATLQTTSGILYINGGSTVEVKTGGVLNSADTLVLGNTAANNGASGTGTLLVTGGVVNSGTTSGSRNFIIGNRAGTAGDVSVTITAGEINGSANASNGLVFENNDQVVGQNTIVSNAVFNLDGGMVSARRIVKSITGTSTGSSVFNFNGGILRVIELPPGTFLPGEGQFLGGGITYNVKERGAIFDTNGFDVTINQPLQHSGTGTDGGFTKLGAGVLSLSSTNAANNYNGGTKIEEGTLSITADSNLGALPTVATASNLVINGGATLRIAPTGTTLTLGANRGIALGPETGTGTGTFEVDAGKALEYSGIITNRGTGSGGLTKTGDGILSLSGTAANTFSGPITVKAGLLRIGNVSRFGASSNDPSNLILDGGTLEFTAGGVVERGMQITSNGGTIQGNSWRVNGNITGSGTLTINPGSFISTSGDNSSFTGDINVAGGEFQLRKATSLGTTAGSTSVASGAALALDQNGTNGGGNLPAENDYKDALFLADNATLRNKGGTSTGATDSIYSGAITLQAGTANVDVLGRALTIKSQITGSGGLNKTGTGNLFLGNTNSYTGKTTVAAGRLALIPDETFGDDSSIASSPWIQVDSGATFDVTGNVNTYATSAQVFSGRGTFKGNFNLSGSAVIKPGDSSVPLLANIANAGNLTGTLNVDGNLTFASNGALTTRMVFGLGGTGTDEFDHINVSGMLNVGNNTRIEVVWKDGYVASSGSSFDLIDWSGVNVSWGNFVANSTSFLALPDFAMGSGLSWNTSQFLATGVISVVPEPSRAFLLLLSTGFLIFPRRRSQVTTF